MRYFRFWGKWGGERTEKSVHSEGTHELRGWKDRTERVMEEGVVFWGDKGRFLGFLERKSNGKDETARGEVWNALFGGGGEEKIGGEGTEKIIPF